MFWVGKTEQGNCDTGSYPIFLQKIVWEGVGGRGVVLGGVCPCNRKTSFSMGVSASIDQSQNSYTFVGGQGKVD